MALEYSRGGEASAEADLASDAAAAIRSWRPIVAGIPGQARGDGRAEALDALVRWYQRVCADPACTDLAPSEGLDALTDELTEARAGAGLDRLARARWAVRVGEELVHWRACRAGQVAPARVRVASSRLELALKGARSQFRDGPAGSSS